MIYPQPGTGTGSSYQNPYMQQYAAPYQQPQQQQSNPMQMMQLMRAMGSGSGGGSVAAGTAPDFGSISPGIAAGAEPTITGGSTGLGGGTGAAALYANPYAWLAALIGGGALGLQHNNVSSIPHDFQGKTGTDILHSQNVTNFAKDKMGNAWGGASLDVLRPFTDSLDPSRWGQVPEDTWHAMSAPFHALRKLL